MRNELSQREFVSHKTPFCQNVKINNSLDYFPSKQDAAGYQLQKTTIFSNPSSKRDFCFKNRNHLVMLNIRLAIEMT